LKIERKIYPGKIVKVDVTKTEAAEIVPKYRYSWIIP